MSSPHGQKRTADEFAPPSNTFNLTTTDPNTPRIIRRHQHRRRNIATATWGPELPPPPARLQSFSSSNLSTSSRTRPFNIYKSLLRHPHLFFQFAVRLPLPTILSLYAIDKEFHYRLNKYSVGLIHEYALYHAPLAAPIFAWRLHPQLCISDPMLRPMDGREWLARDVPGFRWVGMVLSRQRIVNGVLSSFAREGLRVPRGAFEALCKLWCLMECPSTELREAFLRDKKVWRDEDLVLVQLVAVKLDMRFEDPVLGNGIAELGRLLLAQRGLGLLHKVLKGKVRFEYDDVTDLVVRTYLTEDLDTEMHPWLEDEIENGIPEEEWGILSREGWDMDGERMDSALEMVIMEGMRRSLGVHRWYLDFVLYGFVDEGGENVATPRLRRRQGVSEVIEMGWPKQHVREDALRRLKAMTVHEGVDTMDIDT
ncbi:hypothetical protein E8E13_007896 [Curvularia kusanoi]|uniref:Uncharacterized protein n=1 Tax=Curvularia kusanoi TaxID=90978 RepID=A0A9P4TL43_CURKU|nr:hypothetical protein E8E13_007896 [Curvularia kusanoi]